MKVESHKRPRASAAIHLVAAVIGSGAFTGLFAQTLKTGEQVYQETCAACHASGVANAPKFGDKDNWAPLIAEGQEVLTAHGWVGVRGMPPKGGMPDLSLEEFARATAYMARSAGAGWKDPDGEMLELIRREERKRISKLQGTGSTGK